MTVIAITHTLEYGTLARGARPSEPGSEVLMREGMLWAPSLGAFTLRETRMWTANPFAIERIGDALKAAGYAVTTHVDNSRPARDHVGESVALLYAVAYTANRLASRMRDRALVLAPRCDISERATTYARLSGRAATASARIAAAAALGERISLRPGVTEHPETAYPLALLREARAIVATAREHAADMAQAYTYYCA